MIWRRAGGSRCPPMGSLAHRLSLRGHCFRSRRLWLPHRRGGSACRGFCSRRCRYDRMRPIHLTTGRGGHLHHARASGRPRHEISVEARQRRIAPPSPAGIGRHLQGERSRRPNEQGALRFLQVSLRQFELRSMPSKVRDMCCRKRRLTAESHREVAAIILKECHRLMFSCGRWNLFSRGRAAIKRSDYLPCRARSSAWRAR